MNNEGYGALWKGHIAAQALSGSYGFIQFGLFEGITSHVSHYPGYEQIQPGINFSAGLFSGCMATIISFPFDTIRTRLVVQGEPKVNFIGG